MLVKDSQDLQTFAKWVMYVQAVLVGNKLIKWLIHNVWEKFQLFIQIDVFLKKKKTWNSFAEVPPEK